ncbi:MAG: sirohydrochlorin cobaltochelatase [Desulfovibrio sp.]
MKSAILIAGHGSRYERAQQALEHIVQTIQERDDSIPVRLAYTSHKIRTQLNEDGSEAKSPQEVLNDFKAMGITHVVMQSLHVIRAKEYSILTDLAERLRGDEDGFVDMQVGMPLLAGTDDIENVCQAFISLIPEDMPKNEALLFMGHGSIYVDDPAYEALNSHLHDKGVNIYVGTMDSTPDLPEVIRRMKADNITHIHLRPFLFGAGFHATKDLVGKDDSWKNILEAAGFTCEPEIVGLGENERFLDVWIAHLDHAMKKLNKRCCSC